MYRLAVMNEPIHQYDCGEIRFYLNDKVIMFSTNFGKRTQQNFVVRSPLSPRHKSLAKIRKRIINMEILNLDDLASNTYPDLNWVPTQGKIW